MRTRRWTSAQHTATTFQMMCCAQGTSWRLGEPAIPLQKLFSLLSLCVWWNVQFAVSVLFRYSTKLCFHLLKKALGIFSQSSVTSSQQFWSVIEFVEKPLKISSWENNPTTERMSSLGKLICSLIMCSVNNGVEWWSCWDPSVKYKLLHMVLVFGVCKAEQIRSL